MWVTAEKFEKETGFKRKAMDYRRSSGHWQQGVVWVKGADGFIYYSLEGYQSWLLRQGSHLQPSQV